MRRGCEDSSKCSVVCRLRWRLEEMRKLNHRRFVGRTYFGMEQPDANGRWEGHCDECLLCGAEYDTRTGPGELVHGIESPLWEER